MTPQLPFDLVSLQTGRFDIAPVTVIHDFLPAKLKMKD
jgi:hypothetical protein